MRRLETLDGGGSRAHGPSVTHSVMQAIVAWCEALNGSLSLTDALAALVHGLGAEAGMILRTHSSDNRPSRIAVHDLAHGFAYRELKRSYADGYFGSVLEGARAGTIWQASAHADDSSGDPALGEWQASRRYREFVVLVLSTSAKQRDHIELHFRDPLTPETEATLATMMPNMARIWACRRVGLITRSIINHRPATPDQPDIRPQANLLGVENPARLSRAEFRVCLMLARGLSVTATADELSLSEATVRSHLHSVYGKTGCSSLAELVFRLLAVQPEADFSRSRVA